MPSAPAIQMRTVKDSLGLVDVGEGFYYGAQTERARRNFQISLPRDRMPVPLIYTLALIKEAAAIVNCQKGGINSEKCTAITQACKEIYGQKFDDQFPLSIWQTGSGTQTNMNVNEVIAGRATEILYGSKDNANDQVHPNDDVNCGQSSNDIFPTAMNICVAVETARNVVPSLEQLRDSLHEKSISFMKMIKIGRTHLQDAVPMTVGQELSAFVEQLNFSISSIKENLKSVCRLAVGGTAVGTGLNCPQGFDFALCEQINQLLKERSVKENMSVELEFQPARNKFAALAGHDALLQLSGSFNCVATVLLKLASDFALLSSGPSCGFGEFRLPSNEPGSSIMPGKINPTQCESMSMISLQLMGNHFTVTMAASQGQLQLNVFKPLIAHSMLHSCQLIADSVQCFTEHCVRGLQINHSQLEKNLQHSLMLVTALTPYVGYDKSAELANYARENGIPLREAALQTKLITAEEFDNFVRPEEMAFPMKEQENGENCLTHSQYSP
ncbi:Fumarate hydratase class II [Fasciola hepatica]|uniref:fumarate hydratase n=1 Tax=Fasciola hepatica TaxID=6192 RepID=A0A4E0R6C8_FASHE|nr:Fumarate hydratase class II [Fasciola hepatica]